MLETNEVESVRRLNSAKVWEVFEIHRIGAFYEQGVATVLELVKLEKEKDYEPHYHQYSQATIYITAGSGVFLLGDEQFNYEKGMKITIPAGSWHGFKTHKATHFISMQSPSIINDDGSVDIYYKDVADV